MASKLNVEGGSKTDLWMLPPEGITANEAENGRWVGYSEESIAELVASYESVGQLQPVQVRRLPDGGVALVLGFRRWLAAKRYNELHPDKPMRLKCVLSTLNQEESLIRNITENRERRATTAIDDAHNQRRLVEDYGWTTARVAEFYRCSTTQISNLRKLLTLSREIQLQVHGGEITVAAAMVLADLPEDKRAAVLASAAEPVPVVEDDEPKTTPASEKEAKRREKEKRKRAKEKSKKIVSAARVTKEKGKGGVARKLAEVREFFLGVTGPAEELSLQNLGSAVLAYIGGKSTDEEFTDLLKSFLACGSGMHCGACGTELGR